jgi:hypothetical protein
MRRFPWTMQLLGQASCHLPPPAWVMRITGCALAGARSLARH